MDAVQQLEARRNTILEEMRSIRSMRRGKVNEQYFKTRLKGRKGMVRQIPYYLLSRRQGLKTVSKRFRFVAEHNTRLELILALLSTTLFWQGFKVLF
jgi:hypothetical protein